MCYHMEASQESNVEGRKVTGEYVSGIALRQVQKHTVVNNALYKEASL